MIFNFPFRTYYLDPMSFFPFSVFYLKSDSNYKVIVIQMGYIWLHLTSSRITSAHCSNYWHRLFPKHIQNMELLLCWQEQFLKGWAPRMILSDFPLRGNSYHRGEGRVMGRRRKLRTLETQGYSYTVCAQSTKPKPGASSMKAYTLPFIRPGGAAPFFAFRCLFFWCWELNP